MNIGGFQELSLLDFPGKTCAIVWTVGCNFRCPFCYNSQLTGKQSEGRSEEEILSFLKKRKNVLEGVSITGGEPLLQKDLDVFLGKVKDMGYLVKVDHNGSDPDHLEELLDKGLIDYVAMDVKTRKGAYPTASGVPIDIHRVERCIRIVMDKAPDYEFRTTMVPGISDPDDVEEIARWIKGAKRFYIQQFRPEGELLSKELQGVKPFHRRILWQTLERVRPYVDQCGVRGIK